jgi:phospho-N-acetylmuramoyl-pentapeptide-transferase
MLLELAQWLSKDYRFFSVFNYITLRTVLATLTALGVGLLAGPWLIRKLAQLKIGQAVRSDGPQTHLSKSGTPTMGGVLIVGAVIVSVILWDSVVAKIKTMCSGGSSKVFRKALNALVVSMCTSSMI